MKYWNLNVSYLSYFSVFSCIYSLFKICGRQDVFVPDPQLQGPDLGAFTGGQGGGDQDLAGVALLDKIQDCGQIDNRLDSLTVQADPESMTDDPGVIQAEGPGDIEVF